MIDCTVVVVLFAKNSACFYLRLLVLRCIVPEQDRDVVHHVRKLSQIIRKAFRFLSFHFILFDCWYLLQPYHWRVWLHALKVAESLFHLFHSTCQIIFEFRILLVTSLSVSDESSASYKFWCSAFYKPPNFLGRDIDHLYRIWPYW